MRYFVVIVLIIILYFMICGAGSGSGSRGGSETSVIKSGLSKIGIGSDSVPSEVARVVLFKKLNYTGDTATYLLSSPENADQRDQDGLRGTGKTKTIFKTTLKTNKKTDAPEFGDDVGFLSAKSKREIPLEILVNGIVDTRVSAYEIPNIYYFINNNISPDHLDGVVEVRTFVDSLI